MKKRVNVIFIKLVFQTDSFSLKNLIILDSETIIHVFNNLSWFSNFWKAPHKDYLIVESLKVSVLDYEDVILQIMKEVLRLKNVIFCINFAINLVSFSLLKEKSIYWNIIHNTLFCKSNLSIVEILKKIARQQII